MTWSRFDDRWVDRPVWESVDLAARWHYLCLIQTCSRNGRYDGVMPLTLARRASDVDDPDACHTVLEMHSLIAIVGNELKVVEIDEHIPPPSIRNNAEESKIRMARMRKHKNGDHSDCLTSKCAQAPVTELVTRNTRTGQDRTAVTPSVPKNESVTRNAESCVHGVVNGASTDPWTNKPVCDQCAVTRPADDPAECSICGQQLLLSTPGRTTCEACRLAQGRAS